MLRQLIYFYWFSKVHRNLSLFLDIKISKNFVRIYYNYNTYKY